MKAAEARWKKQFTPKQAEALLKAARPEDDGMDAWKVYNRIQENILKGGIKIEGFKRTPRALTDVRRYEKVNGEIFKAAYSFVGPDDDNGKKTFNLFASN